MLEYQRFFMSSYNKNLFNKISEAINETMLHDKITLVVTPNFKIRISPNREPNPSQEITYIRLEEKEK